MSEDFRNTLSGEPLNDAALWHERLRRMDADTSIWLAFTEWLEADDRHRLAYDDVEALYGAFEELGASAGIEPGAAAVVIPLPPKRSRWALPAAGVAAGLVAASLLVALVLRPSPAIERISTAPGEIRHIVAKDGSVLDLNGGTAITIALSPTQRQVQLDHGEVLFQIAADPRRPFLVAARGYRIRDIGTVFDVVRTDDLTRVSVEQGKVSVTAPGSTSQPVLLAAGERFEQREGGDAALHTIDPATAGSWKNGYLVYEDVPLREVMADIGRYGQRKIVLSGPDASFRHFSGILKIDNEEAMLDRLGQLMPLSIDRAGEGPVMVRAAPVK